MKRLFNTSELHALSQIIIQTLQPEIVKAVREAIENRKEILMPEDVADMLHLSLGALQKRCRRNLLPWHKDATGHYFFYSDEIRRHFYDNSTRAVCEDRPRLSA